MNRKEERNLIVNIFLVIIALILIVTCGILWARQIKNTPPVEEEVELREVGYDSKVEHYGYKDAKGIIDAFMYSYEHLSGESLASMMNLGATYVYTYVRDELSKQGVPEENLKEETIKHFDDKYVEIMKNPSEFQDFVLMQYVMREQEDQIINGMPATVPNFIVLGEPQIEDLTKYLSKIDVNISVISEVEGINQIDTIEMLLLHKRDIYYLMSFDRIATIDANNQ